MSTLERHSVWGWRFALAIAAVLLYAYVIQPLTRAAVNELADTLSMETPDR